MRRRRLATSILVAAALAQATSGSASADTFSRHEPRGDVVRVTDDPAGGEDYAAAPRWRDGDIRRCRMTYGAHRIRVRIDFYELTRRGPRVGLSADFKIPCRWCDNGRDVMTVEIATTRRDRAGDAWLSSTTSDDPTARIDHRIDYAADRITLSFRAAEIGSPRWFRFHVNSLVTKGKVGYVDDAPSGVPNPAWTHRIHRG